MFVFFLCFILILCWLTGKPLQLRLQACDVKGKEEKSGPECMLTEPNTGDGRAYLEAAAPFSPFVVMLFCLVWKMSNRCDTKEYPKQILLRLPN